MSRSVPKIALIKQIKAGVHQVSVSGASIIKESFPTDEIGLTITFKSKDEQLFQKIFWLKGKRHVEFLKMALAAGININAEKFKKEAIGKELWIFIKECYDITGEDLVMVDEKPVINHYIFDYHPIDGGKKPVLLGDPYMNQGKCSGKFLDFNQVGPSIVKAASEQDFNFPLEETEIEQQIAESETRIVPDDTEVPFGEM